MATAGRNGGKKTGGRQKGSVNKFTKSFKDLVSTTAQQFEEEGNGMKQWAEENRTEFYKIASKLIPTEVGLKAAIHTEVHTIKLPDGSQIEI